VTLAAGTRLGPYEVLAPLGAGGMGEVYRVRDASLGREVAIKILPAVLATSPLTRRDLHRRSSRLVFIFIAVAGGDIWMMENFE
jgi:serine/threonine protein kinase